MIFENPSINIIWLKHNNIGYAAPLSLVQSHYDLHRAHHMGYKPTYWWVPIPLLCVKTSLYAGYKPLYGGHMPHMVSTNPVQ
jgi:hypothetical protein